MKLLYVAPSYPPMVGGGERLVQALAQQAVAAGHQVTVVTSDVRQAEDFWRWRPAHGRGDPWEEDEGPIRVIRCPAGGIPGGWPGLLLWRRAMIAANALPGQREGLLQHMSRRVPTLPALRQALDALERHDLVHGFNLSWEHALVEAWRHARERGVPFVVRPDIHLGAPGDRHVARNYTMAHQLRILRDADALVVNTSIEREGLIALGVSPERVSVVGSGLYLPSDAHMEGAGNILERHGLAEPLIVFIGRVERDKGAIDAAKAVLALGGRAGGAPSPCLALIGAIGRDFTRYYGRLSREEQQRIRPLGYLSEEDKHALLGRARALVLPSRVDSFGIVLLEAWAQGKPVIGARAGGIPGVIDHERNGLLVDWGDVQGLAAAIARLLADPAMAQRMGAAGHDKVMRMYTWEAVYRRIEGVYQGLWGAGAPPASPQGEA